MNDEPTKAEREWKVIYDAMDQQIRGCPPYGAIMGTIVIFIMFVMFCVLIMIGAL